jgi:RHS repeat-associated protein
MALACTLRTPTIRIQWCLSDQLTADEASVGPSAGLPFGEQWYETGPTNKWVFTSYDRDSESGLDYVLARYYDSRTGTVCSADPLAGSPSDPQSWNRYPFTVEIDI